MHFSLFGFLACMTTQVAVLACEGDCIVDITNAFLGNYTTSIQEAFKNMAEQTAELFPNREVSPQAALSALQPVLDEYQNQSYSALRTAIFPSYFHGKCQVNGVDPPGCPNPDCPVVCGTPGSLVHYYPKLRLIAFECIQGLLRTLVSPGSDSYLKVQQAVLAYAGSSNKPERISQAKRLQQTLGRFPAVLQNACGGSSLSKCSWEADMKSFILSFP